MTGLADIQTVITPKRLEILRAAVPRATRFGVLWTPTAPSGRPFVQAAEATGGKLGIQLQTVSVSTVAEFDGAFAKMAQGRAGGVLVHGAALTGRQARELLAEVALKHRLPTMFGIWENVLAGGLMSYGPDHLDLTRRAAVYIDKILKGAKPADLPIEQASKYQLGINLKTANKLGLTIPQSVLQRSLSSTTELQRTCSHALLGRLTIEQIIGLLPWHDDNHLDQLKRALEGKA